jgi:hypothetical protein
MCKKIKPLVTSVANQIEPSYSEKEYLERAKNGEDVSMYEPTLYPRKCDNCGKGMNEGWCWDMGYACSDKCLFVDGYTESQLKEDLEMDTIYWTEWEELDYDENYTKNGDKITNLYAEHRCYDGNGNVVVDMSTKQEYEICCSKFKNPKDIDSDSLEWYDSDGVEWEEYQCKICKKIFSVDIEIVRDWDTIEEVKS